MMKFDLKPCPFCGDEVKLKEYRESIDGRGDETAEIECKKCKALMYMGRSEISALRAKHNHTGGYMTENKELMKDIHETLADRWNTRAGG